MAVKDFLSAPCRVSLGATQINPKFPGRPWEVTEHCGPFSNLLNWRDVPPPPEHF